jgi:hypothetical protein
METLYKYYEKTISYGEFITQNIEIIPPGGYYIFAAKLESYAL